MRHLLGSGPFRWVALSGDPEDIYVTDRIVLDLFPGNDHLRRLARVLTTDPGMGIVRHADAGCPQAIAAAKQMGVKIPMLRD